MDLNDSSWWTAIMIHHDEYWWITLTPHDEAAWPCIMMMHHDDSSRWVMMTQRDGPWWFIINRVALEGFLSGLSWPFAPWAPSIHAARPSMAPMISFQAETPKWQLQQPRRQHGEQLSVHPHPTSYARARFHPNGYWNFGSLHMCRFDNNTNLHFWGSTRRRFIFSARKSPNTTGGGVPGRRLSNPMIRLLYPSGY